MLILKPNELSIVGKSRVRVNSPIFESDTGVTFILLQQNSVHGFHV